MDVVSRTRACVTSIQSYDGRPRRGAARVKLTRRRRAALAAATATHPHIADTLRERYILGQREHIASCLHRARDRGELTAERVDRLLAPGRMEIAAAVGVLVLQEDLLGAVLDRDGISRLVDQVLLPLVEETRTD